MRILLTLFCVDQRPWTGPSGRRWRPVKATWVAEALKITGGEYTSAESITSRWKGAYRPRASSRTTGFDNRTWAGTSLFTLTITLIFRSWAIICYWFSIIACNCSFKADASLQIVSHVVSNERSQATTNPTVDLSKTISAPSCELIFSILVRNCIGVVSSAAPAARPFSAFFSRTWTSPCTLSYWFSKACASDPCPCSDIFSIRCCWWLRSETLS